MTSTTPSGPGIAVIVCCYTADRMHGIESCVLAAHKQLADRDELIVVVDHNDALRETLTQRFPTDVRVIANSEGRGLSGARNSGLHAARSAILVFVDDDATLRPGSLDAVRTTFADGSIVAVGGAVFPDWEDSVAPRWFPDEFGWIVGCDYRGIAPDGGEIRNPIGAAMAVRREALLAIDGFSDRLGRVGTVPAGCEETLMGIELRSRFPQTRIVRVARFAVDHVVPRSRGTVRYFTSRCRHEGRSKAILSSMVGAGSGLSAERSFVTRTLPTGVARYLRGAIAGGGTASLLKVLFLFLGLGTTAAATLFGSVFAARARNTRAQAPTPGVGDEPPLAADELVSVVVPSVGRPSLRDTVRAVLAQDHPQLELVVVDNRPGSGAVREAMAEFTDPRVRVSNQRVPGVSAARNKGATEARGRVIAFTDDDALPGTDWVSEILASFRADTTGAVGAVTGRVLGTESATPEQEWFEAAGVFDKGTQPTVWAMQNRDGFDALGTFGAHGPFFPFTAGECGTGNNMAFRPSALRAVAGFDENLGTGTPTHGGEDLDIYRSVILRGWAIAYNPNAVVRHYHRDNMSDLRVQSYGYGTGMAASLTKLVMSGDASPSTVAKKVPRGLHMLLSPNSSKNADVPSEWPVHLRLLEIWGYLVGPILYLRSRFTAPKSDLYS